MLKRLPLFYQLLWSPRLSRIRQTALRLVLDAHDTQAVPRRLKRLPVFYQLSWSPPLPETCRAALRLPQGHNAVVVPSRLKCPPSLQVSLLLGHWVVTRT